MSAKSQMYVLLEVGASLSLVDAELDRVGDYDCLVDVLYTSVCGTQVGEIRGTRTGSIPSTLYGSRRSWNSKKYWE